VAVRSDVTPRPSRVPLRSRSRKRWAAAAGIAVVWVLFLAKTGSLVAGTILFVMLAVAAILIMLALRSLGIGRDHPWVQRMAERPWRDGRDVLQLGLRHLPEVFIVTPSGSLLAPEAVELRMNPGDLASLTQAMDLALINSSASEVYQDQVAARGIEQAGPGPAWVSVIGDPEVPAGRYRLRPGSALGQPPGQPAGQALRQPGAPLSQPPAPPLGRGPAWPSPRAQPPGDGALGYGRTRADADGRVTMAAPAADRTVEAGALTVAEPVPVPLLRLVTQGHVAETRVSGARAGRGGGAELRLPEVPTVSRVHASFTFADGKWRITGLGRNGVTLNGRPLNGEQVLHDCDRIGWGSQPDALVSRVEIGWSRAMAARSQP